MKNLLIAFVLMVLMAFVPVNSAVADGPERMEKGGTGGAGGSGGGLFLGEYPKRGISK